MLLDNQSSKGERGEICLSLADPIARYRLTIKYDVFLVNEETYYGSSTHERESLQQNQ